MASPSYTTNNLEWALRVCESVAFGIHGLLGLTEPWTGCLRTAFGDEHRAVPVWFWPAAGAMLWTVAACNFSPSGAVVLAAQAYIAAFHTGAYFYHSALGHHPAAGLVPTLFAVLATVVVGIRTGSFGLALLGLVACTGIAYLLSKVLVTPPPSLRDDDGSGLRWNLMEDERAATTTNRSYQAS